MKHRLFVAVDLPGEVKSQIEKLQLTLDKLRLPVKWELPQKVHLTLSFLGRLADEDVNQARRIVANTARIFSPHTLQLVAIGTLYQRHEPSLIYLLVADRSGELTDLQAELARRVDEITPQPQHKFWAHVTIGRVLKSDPTVVKHSLDKLEEVDIDPLVEFEVDKICLYESFLTKAGSSYQRLGSFNLGNKR